MLHHYARRSPPAFMRRWRKRWCRLEAEEGHQRLDEHDQDGGSGGEAETGEHCGDEQKGFQEIDYHYDDLKNICRKYTCVFYH